MANSDVADQLHEEFRALIMVLSLVTAINHGGHSTLRPSHGDGPLRLRAIFDKADSDEQILALNAVSTLLVRRTEVVVVTSFSTSLHSSLETGLDTAGICVIALKNNKSGNGDISPDGDDDRNQADRATDEEIHDFEKPPTTFVICTNASPHDRHFEAQDDRKVMQVDSVPPSSCWPTIVDLPSVEILKMQ